MNGWKSRTRTKTRRTECRSMLRKRFQFSGEIATVAGRRYRYSNFNGLSVFGHDDLGFWFHPAQGFGEGQRLRFFAVNDADFFEVAGDAFDVAAQFVFIGMAG